jgi:DNA-binding transcriptional ArsR family regulator
MQSGETEKTPAGEVARNRIMTRIVAEPAYRWVFYKILKFCETPRPVSQVEEAMRSFPEMANSAHSSALLLSWLEQVGAIEKVFVGRDEGSWQTTPAGRKVAEEESPEKKILTLFSAEPACREIYKQVLNFCRTPRTRSDIEDLLDGKPRLEKLGVRPIFFVERLEDAGGLEWTQKSWCTTQAGTQLL